MMLDFSSALSAMFGPLRRSKMGGFQENLVPMFKSFLILVLLQGALVQGEPGLDFVLTQSGINGFVNDTVNEALEHIVDRMPLNPKYGLTPKDHFLSFWDIKVLDMNLQAPNVSMEPGKGIHVAINTSFRINSSLFYEKRNPPYMKKAKGSATIESMNINLLIEVTKNGKVEAKKCKALIGKFRPSFEDLSLNAFIAKRQGDKLKADFEHLTCEVVLNSVNYVIAGKLDFMTPFEYGPLRLNYHINKTVSVDQDSIRAHLNGRFDGDSENLKLIDMYLPAEGMAGLSVSEEVIESAVRVWHKATFADATFELNARDIERIFPFKWLHSDKLLQIKIHAPSAPNVSIAPNGILASASGSIELHLLNPESEPNNFTTITLTTSVWFDISLAYRGFRIAIKDFEFEISKSNNLMKLDEIFKNYKDAFLMNIRKKFVIWIPIFKANYFKSAWMTVKDKFLQVFVELSYF